MHGCTEFEWRRVRERGLLQGIQPDRCQVVSAHRSSGQVKTWRRKGESPSHNGATKKKNWSVYCSVTATRAKVATATTSTTTTTTSTATNTPTDTHLVWVTKSHVQSVNCTHSRTQLCDQTKREPHSLSRTKKKKDFANGRIKQPRTWLNIPRTHHLHKHCWWAECVFFFVGARRGESSPLFLSFSHS